MASEKAGARRRHGFKASADLADLTLHSVRAAGGARRD